MPERVHLDAGPLDRLLLATVNRLVPEPYGSAVAGDLAEAWTEGHDRAHARAAFDAVLRCWGALARRTVRTHRVPLASGAALGATAHLAAMLFWRTVLSLVPLRADHPPSLAWVIVTSTLAAAAAALGWHLARALRERPSIESPESLA